MWNPGWGSLLRPSILSPACPLPRSSFAPPKLLGPSPCPHPSVPVSRDSREFAPFGPLQGPALSPAPCPRHRSRTSLGSPGWEVAGPPEKTRRKSPRRAGAARRPPAASASSTSPRPRPAPRPRPHRGPPGRLTLSSPPQIAPRPEAKPPWGAAHERLILHLGRCCGGHAPPRRREESPWVVNSSLASLWDPWRSICSPSRPLSRWATNF